MKLSCLLHVLLLTTLLTAGPALATAQQGDVLIVNGKEEALYTNPLADWLALHPGALPKSDVTSTANWRGYVATWELADGKLWLRRVDVTFRQGTIKTTVTGIEQDKQGRFVSGKTEVKDLPDYVRRDVRDQLFPGRSEVVADWYTGTMIIPKGKILDYVHMGYGSTYERYTVIWIRHGDVTRQLDLRADQFMALRKQRFKAYQQTPEYQKQFAESLQQREGGTAAEIEDFLFEFDAERYLSIDPDAVDQ